jgi:uncharacterized protein (DUF885 family)
VDCRFGMRSSTILLAAAVASVGSVVPQLTRANPSTHAAEQFKALVAASDEAQLKLNPLQALLRGDLRYADQFGDQITDAYFAAEKQTAVEDLAALARINRSALSHEERISYDVFQYQRNDDLKGFAPVLVIAQIDRPIDHFNGVQAIIPEVSSGDGVAPFNTLADYENNIKRLEGYVVYLDRAIERMRHGLATGVTNPKLVMVNVVHELDALIAEGVEGSTFYRPILKFPEAISQADRSRLTDSYASFIREKLIPAHSRLRDFLNVEYLPHARDSVGLGQMPGGRALYRYLVASQTTTAMTPEEIHKLGLSEVDRIHAGMDKVKDTVGFKGTLKEFVNFLRTDPRFAPASADAMRDAFLAIDKQVLAAIPRDFNTVPKSLLEIRPVPAYKEKTEAAAYYVLGAPDGSRPGVFSYNTYDLPERFTWEFETLFLHEGIPGHHFQISLALENTALPAFQRFGGNTAFAEGWALYSESLGAELGMFTDPYQLFGHLDDEILRAMRLVVDTGIHNEGWSRDAAIAYMLDNSAMSPTEVTSEVERYIAIPGQALAYKVGELTIRRLRTKAELKLGSKFDPRDFHAQVLMSGALPMAVLEKKINDWINHQLK